VVIEKFGIYLAPLDPTVGVEMGKTRPVLVISPDEMSRTVRTVIIAPMTSTRKKFPYRVNCVVDGREGQIALDQMRALDRVRFIRRLGTLDKATAARVTATLAELFK